MSKNNWTKYKLGRTCSECGVRICDDNKSGFCTLHAIAEHNAKWKKISDKFCIICNKKLTKNQCSKNKNKSFCSKKCHGEYAVGINNPFYGKKHSPKTIEINRNSKKKWWQNKERRDKQGEILTQRWQNKEYREDQIKKHSGENNVNWTGGKSLEIYPSEFSNNLKKEIRKRDEYTCQGKNCGITEIEHQMKYGKNLCVHHLDYDKENCSEVNLITVCHRCNMRANTNRKYWEEYFTDLMISRIPEELKKRKEEESKW
jgi:hypothetical protein